MQKFFKILLCLMFSLRAFGLSCPKVDEKSFAQLTGAQSEGKKLIFFASWCQSCVEKIQSASPKTAILVGVFDTRENIERSYQFLGSKVPCLYGGERAEKHFNVKYLPYEQEKSNKS